MRPLILLIPLAALAQDAVNILAQVRDKVVAEHNRLPNYVCTETIERRYYSRSVRGKPTCEGLAADRDAPQRLRLDKSDRLRLSVQVLDGRETLAWTGSAPAGHIVEDILNNGPIGTGPAAAHLLEVFTNPAVSFRLLGDPSAVLSYGFRMPVEESKYVVWANREWTPVGYGGTLRIAADSFALLRLDLRTDELPAESNMCQEDTVLGFDEREASRFSWLVPVYSRTRNIDPDGSEIDRLTTISDCHEGPADPPPAPARRGTPLPFGVPLTLRLDSAIDSDTAAAGDPVSATVAVDPHAGTQPDYAGAKVRGRIVGLTVQHHPRPVFLVTIAFDTFEQNGEERPFFAQIFDKWAVPARQPQQERLRGDGVQDWPNGLLDFPSLVDQDHYVVGAGFSSEWRTTRR